MRREFLVLAAVRCVKLTLNVVTLVLYGRLFGVGPEMDAWILASSIVAAAGMAIWGAVNETVRSRYVHEKEDRGETEANKTAVSLIVFTTGISVLLCLVLYFCTPAVIRYFSSDNELAPTAEVTHILVLLLPSLVLVQLLNLVVSYMNCYGVVYLPEFTGIAGALLNILCTILLATELGVHAIVWGYYAGLLVSTVVILNFLIAKGFFGSFVWSAKIIQSGFSAVAFALPLFLAYLIGQANVLYEKYLAGLMGVGVISSVNYASQIRFTLQAVLSSVLFSVVVPRLTLVATQRSGEFKKILMNSQLATFIFILAVVPFVYGASDGLAAVILGSKSEGADAVDVVARLIRLYSLALLPICLYSLYAGALLSQQKGKVYGFLGAFAQLCSMGICAFMYKKLGAEVFPVALFFSHLFVSVLMLCKIDVEGRFLIARNAFAVSTLTVLVAFFCLWLFVYFARAFESSITAVGAAGVGYVLCLAVTGCVFLVWRKKSAVA